MKRQRAERGGRRAESLAAWWLRLQGWRILARRVRTPVGEVDLIARRGRITAFIEVKARGNEADAGFALDDYRLRRVVAAAQALAPRYVPPGGDLRVDALFIVPWRWPRHLANITQG
jgi:putative endonuclease